MAVFNADGEPVMFTLNVPKTHEQEQEIVPVPFYPIPAQWDAAHTDGLELEVIRDDNGSVVRVVSRSDVTPDAKVSAYLVDTTGIDARLDVLRLTWPDGVDGFMTRALVEFSDDMINWTATGTRDTIADLTYGDHRFTETDLRASSINIKKRDRFYRISFPGQTPPPLITGISAVLLASQREPARDEITVYAGRTEVDGMFEYVFDSGGHRPIDRIEVLLPEPNSLADAVIFSRDSLDDAWRERARTRLYRFAQGEGEINPPATSVPVSTDRYWMMRIPKDGGGIGSGSPRMKFMWLPHELTFIARGEMPYTLAYGSAQLSPEKLSSTGYMANLKIGGMGLGDDVEVAPSAASPGKRVTLAGPGVLEHLEPAPDWKKYILWGVLLFGVAILGWMAISLARKMDVHQDG
jgi:hypothetical protein